MTGEGFHERPGYVPDDAPRDRCGYTTDYATDSLFSQVPGNVTCWRETWADHDLCIWHVDLAGKPADELADARADEPERFDGAVLRGTDLNDTVHFTGCELPNSDLGDATFAGADFADADLRWSDLTDAELQYATFRGGDLGGCALTETRLWSVDFTDADLGGVTLPNANLRNGTLTDTTVRGADLTSAYLGGCNLSDADFESAVLVGTNLHATDVLRADLSDADLTDANLEKAILVNSNLRGSTLANTSFGDARLVNADLREATIAEATFEGATLTGASLERAELTDTDLGGSDLTRATLEDATFKNADLDAADLTDARLHNCRLQNVSISDETTFGDRCIYEKEVREAIETDGLTEDQLEPIDKAISIYRTYQRLLRENSLPGDIPHYFYREKEMRRLKARAEGNHLEWGYRALQRWVMGYGERPWRVVITSLLVILAFAGLYPLAGGVELETDVSGPEFLTYLYFSGVTFTTLGYGDVHPLTQAAQQLAVVQSFLGAALMALLVAVLTRRAMR